MSQTPKNKAIAKNVNINDLLEALKKISGSFIDIEIHQFSDMSNKLIIKPVNLEEPKKLKHELQEDDNLSDEPFNSNENTQSNLDNKYIKEIKDLLDLL